MLSSNYFVKAALLLCFVAAACSVLKKEDSDKDILAFLSTFQTSLSKSDEEILTLFDTRKQSTESILQAVRILQNKEDEYIACEANYAQPQINRTEQGTFIVIPVRFKGNNIDVNNEEVETTLILAIAKKDDAFVITQLDGEAFYKTFADIRNDLKWSTDRQRALDVRKPVYDLAREIQTQFDSVIWYTQYNNATYFYVVKGAWEVKNHSKRGDTSQYKMGLVDERGAIVIPVEYELVRTIGFGQPSIVEVVKNGKTGYFNVDTKKMVIEPAYDQIIPYSQETNVRAIVKNDSTYGWLNSLYQYQDGFPSEQIKQWVYSYEFLPEKILIKNGEQNFCETPNAEYAGAGVVLPPSYLVQSGLFTEIVSGISTTPFPLNGWTEYIETEKPLLQKVTDGIQALITSITERYLEGREEFYKENRLVFVNQNSDTLSVATLSSDSVIHMKRLANNVLEVKTPCYYCFEPYPANDAHLPDYAFFALADDGTVRQLKSRRSFPATEFIKLDSSYLTGKFVNYAEESSESRETTFLSLATITYLRDEILANNGYIFPDEETATHFTAYDWYSPRYKSREDIDPNLTEEDRHNLAFLERMIERLKAQPV